MSRIVVGVDGSPASRRALEFALDAAQPFGDEVEAVMVIPRATPVWVDMPSAMYLPPELEELQRKGAAAQLDHVVDQVLRDRRESADVRRSVAQGPPSSTLLDLARGADLLVVGSRGLGGFRRLLLGSVSQQCVTHAPCPVAVVPCKRPDDDDRVVPLT